MKLEVRNLHVEVEGKEILKGITLSFEKGKVIALMGPNGSGKSTLANTLMGSPQYKITNGQILLDDKDITDTNATERAKLGIFLSFQYPHEIEGITLSTFLRAIIKQDGKKMKVLEFRKLLKEKMQELNMDESFAQRYLNVGFSGGEKKRAEILQMSLLNPTFAILDETDSGLDVDALKIIGEGINKVKGDKCIILITHYNRILEYIQPDEVYVFNNGQIIKSGTKELAKEIEEKGFGWLINE